MAVGESVENLPIGQSTVSHHLKIPAEVRFVLAEARGTLPPTWATMPAGTTPSPSNAAASASSSSLHDTRARGWAKIPNAGHLYVRDHHQKAASDQVRNVAPGAAASSPRRSLRHDRPICCNRVLPGGSARPPLPH